MRTFVLGAAGVILLGLTVAAARSAPSHSADTATVNVHVNCQGSRVSFWVDPWAVSITQGDDVHWRLQGNSTSNAISVVPKRGATWPFNGNPVAGTKADPARSGGPANRVGRHQYNITLQCPGGPTVVIDPDIVID